jgi:hypothetical protein
MKESNENKTINFDSHLSFNLVGCGNDSAVLLKMLSDFFFM